MRNINDNVVQVLERLSIRKFIAQNIRDLATV